MWVWMSDCSFQKVTEMVGHCPPNSILITFREKVLSEAICPSNKQFWWSILSLSTASEMSGNLKWRKENIWGNSTQGFPCHKGWWKQYCRPQNRARAKTFYILVNFVGKTTLLLCIKMFITAPVLSYSSPNIDDSWHNSVIYWWVSLGLDKLWCNSDRMIVTWMFNTAQ